MFITSGLSYFFTFYDKLAIVQRKVFLSFVVKRKEWAALPLRQKVVEESPDSIEYRTS